MESRKKAARPLASVGRVLVGAGILGLTVLLSSCGGGGSDSSTPVATTPPGSPGSPGGEGSGAGTPPQGGIAANGDIVDGYGYPKSVPLQNVKVTILPPTAGGACRGTDGNGFDKDGNVLHPAPGTTTTADYSGCTLAMVNAGVKATENFCDTTINGLPTIASSDFKPYVKVLFSADGYDPDPRLTAGGNGQMKLNGHTTRCASQKGYEIDLGKGVDKSLVGLVTPYNGLMEVLLKKHPYDLTRIRNSLSFYLFQSVPDMVSRPTWLLHATFVDTSGDANTQAYLGDQANAGIQAGTLASGCTQLSATANPLTADCGLFEDIEEDDNWLTAHVNDPNGQFWEAQNFTFEPAEAALLPPNTPDSDGFKAIIEPQGKGYDATTLLAMLRAVNSGLDSVSANPSDYTNNFETVFAQYFHPDNFRTWLAMNILVGNDDTQSQNFFLYKPSTSSQFYFAPWDYDGAWGWYQQAGVDNPRPRWHEGLSNWWGMALVRRYIMTSGEVGNLTTKVDALRGSVFSNTNIQSAIDTAFPMAAINGIEELPPDNAFPDVSFQSSVTTTAQMLAARRAEIAGLPATVQTAYDQYQTSLKRPMPMYQDVSPATDVNGNLIPGSVTLTWDPSYSIAGRALSYDVVLSTSPTQSTANDPHCTAADDTEKVPMLAGGVIGGVTFPQVVTTANQPNGITVALPPPVAPATSTPYYLQVVAYDSAGYCQIAFDQTTVGTNDVFGVYGFDWDGTNVTPLP